MATSNQAPGLAQVLWMEVEKQSFSNQEQVGEWIKGKGIIVFTLQNDISGR